MKTRLLKTLYGKVVRGLPGLGTPAEVAARHADAAPSVAADRMTALYTSLSGATGFVTGLPGFLLLPVTLPADLVGTAALQLHMSAAFAAAAGEDLDDPATRDRCIACLLEKLDHTGENTEEEEVTTRVTTKLAERGVRFAARQATKWGTRAVRNAALRRLGLKRLPFLGGLLGAGSNAYVTAHVARCARAKFMPS